uniref:Family with sequence similarity 13 member C n=1 Tax=Scophthalmus maximus TaxID=52904 RepID=A0A8D3B3M4_SCOMX
MINECHCDLRLGVPTHRHRFVSCHCVGFEKETSSVLCNCLFLQGRRGGGGGGGRCSCSPNRLNGCRGMNNSHDNPSLKLRALEADLGPPPAPVDPQVQDNLPAQQQPLSTEEQSLYLTHKPFLHSPPSLPAQDNNTIDFFPPVESPSPPPSASSPVLSTATLSEDKSGDESSSSPTDTNTSPLLSCFTTSDCPVPSPRCPNLSHSLRYNLDPDTAPSPPCSQHIRMARCSIHTEPGEGSASIAVLNRHIHTLRKRIRHFEERFEQEKHYKPAHNDKTADPEVARLMKELIKSRKQLKELKLRQSEDAGLRGQGGLNPPVKTRRTNKDQREAALTGTDLRQRNNNSNSKPNVEETLNTITNRLKERRRELGVPDSIKEMSHYHMTLEKTSMQKCLLYFESLHGRPSTKQERTLMEPLYDRYRVLKQLLFFSAASTVITTIEEEEGSDEGHPNQRSPGQQPLWLKPPRCVSPEESLHLPSLETSETPLVSPLEEGKGLQLPLITMATLHEASRPELLDHLRMARLEKRRLHQALREFEDHFYMQTGRACQKEDRGPMAEEYCQYKKLKAKLRLLEALLSKQQASTRTS